MFDRVDAGEDQGVKTRGVSYTIGQPLLYRRAAGLVIMEQVLWYNGR